MASRVFRIKYQISNYPNNNCMNESVALIISNIAIIFTNLSVWNCRKAERQTERNLNERFAKSSNFYLIDFLHFFAKRRISIEKITHRKKNRGHRPKIVNPRKVIAIVICHCSLYYLARTLDAWRGVWISCAVRIRRNNLARTSLNRKEKENWKKTKWKISRKRKPQNNQKYLRWSYGIMKQSDWFILVDAVFVLSSANMGSKFRYQVCVFNVTILSTG